MTTAGLDGELQNGDFDTIPLDALADHAPILYATHIWNN